MKISKYIKNACETLGLICNGDKSKTKKLELAISEYRNKKKIIESELKTVNKKNKNKNEKEEEEELAIVNLQIKKGEKILKEKKDKK